MSDTSSAPKAPGPGPQSLQLAEFMDIFSGNSQAFGQHQYAKVVAGQKEAGKSWSVPNKLLTMEQYKAHLSGQMGLGIVPIDERGEAKFGVIDLDVYDADLSVYIDAIERNDFPLVPFRSKSGGLHLYLFMRQAVNAKALVDVLTTLSSILGLDLYVKHRLNRIIEVFPKQTKVATGGVGSWINIPYYNSADTNQYAMRGGKPLSLDEALTYIKSKRMTLTEVRSFINDIPFSDGPPCLQTINLLNIMGPNSGRNNYLFSFGVYLKKKDPEFWEQKLFEINANMKSPLPKDEVETTIVNSLRKKDYALKCNEQPCADYCRKGVCKTREFGIGKEGGYFSDLEFGKLTQIRSYEPYYEWEVRLQGDDTFKSLRFKSEQDIIGQDAFLRMCVRDLHTLPVKMKQSEWFKLINQALAEIAVVQIDKEDDTTPIGIFKMLFTEFLIGRAMAQTREQILNKRVYYDERNEKYFFRACDLNDFVFVSKNFRYYAPGEVHGMLRDFKAEATRIKTESGKQLRVYEITKEAVANLGLVIPEVFRADFKSADKEF